MQMLAASFGAAMIIKFSDPALVASVKEHEGLRLSPYHCTADKLTIGYGRRLDRPGGGITKGEAEDMLRHDLQDALMHAEGLFPNLSALSANRQRVIVEMIHQLGPTGVRGFSKFRKAISRGDWDAAADEMLDSKWHRKDTPARAKKLAARFRQG